MYALAAVGQSCIQVQVLLQGAQAFRLHAHQGNALGAGDLDARDAVVRNQFSQAFQLLRRKHARMQAG